MNTQELTEWQKEVLELMRKAAEEPKPDPIVEYRLLSTGFDARMENTVDKALAAGWQLWGAPLHCNGCCVQAMVRRASARGEP